MIGDACIKQNQMIIMLDAIVTKNSGLRFVIMGLEILIFW